MFLFFIFFSFVTSNKSNESFLPIVGSSAGYTSPQSADQGRLKRLVRAPGEILYNFLPSGGIAVGLNNIVPATASLTFNGYDANSARSYDATYGNFPGRLIDPILHIFPGKSFRKSPDASQIETSNLLNQNLDGPLITQSTIAPDGYLSAPYESLIDGENNPNNQTQSSTTEISTTTSTIPTTTSTIPTTTSTIPTTTSTIPTTTSTIPTTTSTIPTTTSTIPTTTSTIPTTTSTIPTTTSTNPTTTSTIPTSTSTIPTTSNTITNTSEMTNAIANNLMNTTETLVSLITSNIIDTFGKVSDQSLNGQNDNTVHCILCANNKNKFYDSPIDNLLSNFNPDENTMMNGNIKNEQTLSNLAARSNLRRPNANFDLLQTNNLQNTINPLTLPNDMPETNEIIFDQLTPNLYEIVNFNKETPSIHPSYPLNPQINNYQMAHTVPSHHMISNSNPVKLHTNFNNINSASVPLSMPFASPYYTKMDENEINEFETFYREKVEPLYLGGKGLSNLVQGTTNYYKINLPNQPQTIQMLPSEKQIYSARIPLNFTEDQIKQIQIGQDQIIQNKIRQNKISQDEIRQYNIKQNQMIQDQISQSQAILEKARQELTRQDQIKQNHTTHEQTHQTHTTPDPPKQVPLSNQAHTFGTYNTYNPENNMRTNQGKLLSGDGTQFYYTNNNGYYRGINDNYPKQITMAQKWSNELNTPQQYPNPQQVTTPNNPQRAFL